MKHDTKCPDCELAYRDFAAEGSAVCECAAKAVRAMKAEDMGQSARAPSAAAGQVEDGCMADFSPDDPANLKELLKTPSVLDRACTCHPDDNPPRPCPQRFAYSECVAALSAPPPEQVNENSIAKAIAPYFEEGCTANDAAKAVVRLLHTRRLPEIALCDWPEGEMFSFFDEPGEHDPCYVVMPGGAMIALNHDARPHVDIARAKFIAEACNAALALPPEQGEAVAWADSEGRERPVDAEAMKLLRQNPTTESYWSRFNIPLYTHAAPKPPAVTRLLEAVAPFLAEQNIGTGPYADCFSDETTTERRFSYGQFRELSRALSILSGQGGGK